MNTAAHEESSVMKTNFGMWLFLASEVMIFGVLILLFEVNLSRFHEFFREASGEIHFMFGTINTFVLLTSSWLVALGLLRKKPLFIYIAMVLGTIFLFIKGTEYYDLTKEGKFIFYFSNSVLPQKKLFFTFYGFLTLLHALHLVIGIALLAFVAKFIKRNEHEDICENIGLYWHFVDLVWVYLYPLFYLTGH